MDLTHDLHQMYLVKSRDSADNDRRIDKILSQEAGDDLVSHIVTPEVVPRYR